jgi:hypothetical protein
MATKNNFADFDAVLDAQMDDLEDLPPVGVPPTGHYNLRVSAERMSNKEATSEYIRFSYEVEAVNEVRDPLEESQAAVGMKFSNNFSPMKKDGTVNEWGIGFLKEAVAPFSAHFGTPKMGDTLAQLQDISVAATLVRRVNKKEPDRFDFNLKDVVVL